MCELIFPKPQFSNLQNGDNDGTELIWIIGDKPWKELSTSHAVTGNYYYYWGIPCEVLP